MAVPKLSNHNRRKQCWRRSPNTCFSGKILLLLVWQILFSTSWDMLPYVLASSNETRYVVFHISIFFSYSFAPLIGLLADVRFGRYEVIKFGTIVSFLVSILYFFENVTRDDFSTLSTVLSSVVFVVVSFGFTCYSSSMFPFATDQLIGATSDEISTVVCWVYWAENLGGVLSNSVAYLFQHSTLKNVPLYILLFLLP